MMPGLIHVSGPSGSGKTTLMGMLSNPNLVIMDTDAVTDPIWREAQRTVSDFKAQNKLADALTKQAVLDAYYDARRQGKWLCIIGMAMGPITQCELGFVVKVDPVTGWRQYSGRTLKSIAQNAEAMAADIAAVKTRDDVRDAIVHWSTDFEIRGPFPGDYDRQSKWYEAAAKDYRGYACLEQRAIADRLNRLGPKMGK